MHLQAFDWIMMGFITAMTCFLIFDIAHIMQGKQQFGLQKFALYIKAQNHLRVVFFALLIIASAELVVSVLTPDVKMLYSILLTAMAAFVYGLNERIPPGISENGLLFRGGFVSWEKIKNITIKDDILVMTISKTYGRFAFDNNVVFTYDFEYKDEICKLLRQHAGIFITQ